MLSTRHEPTATAHINSSRRIRLSALILGLVLSLSPHAVRGRQAPAGGIHAIDTDRLGQVSELQQGESIARELKGGAVDVFSVRLEPGLFVKVMLDQGIHDLAASVFAPDGSSLGDTDGRWSGPESIARIATAAGLYRFEVRTVDPLNQVTEYTARIDILRPAAAGDEDALAAERISGEGKRLVKTGTAESFRKAIGVYEDALARWSRLGDAFAQAQTLNTLGFVLNAVSENHQAIARYEQALALWRSIGYTVGAGETLNNLAAAHSMLGDKQEALDLYQQALEVSRSTRDARREAGTLTSISAIRLSLGQPRDALEAADSGLRTWQAVGDPVGEVQALNAMARIAVVLGDAQRALNGFARMLEIAGERDRRGAAFALRNMGTLYYSLGVPDRALPQLQRALTLFRDIGDRRSEAYTLLSIARCQAALDKSPDALVDYDLTIAAARQVADRTLQAIALNDSGTVLLDQRDYEAAARRFREALAILDTNGDRTTEAAVMTNLGRLQQLLGDRPAALDAYRRAVALFRAVSDKDGEAAALGGLARVERDDGRLEEARAHVENALDIFESFRTTVADPDVRASYLAGKQSFYALNIDVLMALHRRHPEAGYQRAALQASERARARALLDMLAESRGELRRGVDPLLLDRERILREAISATAMTRSRLLTAKSAGAEAAGIQTQLDSLLSSHQQVLGQIRSASPRYAALTQPRPLTAEQIQRLLDADTVLLQFALGEDRSTVWAVTPQQIASFELPPRAAIEAVARRVYDLLSAGGREATSPEFVQAATRLSDILLGPVAAHLRAQRLVIVADGILQFIPFGALPGPGSAPADGRITPLASDHALVFLPSASVLATIREGTHESRPDKTIAVIADPVFRSGDPRVRAAAAASAPVSPSGVESAAAWPSALQRSAIDVGVNTDGLGFPRLPSTRREAEEILKLAPPGSRLRALDFEASRTTAMDATLGRYRIVHFATHGFLDSTHPDLSGVVLSLVDRHGRPQDGFLRLHDIYNLTLPAELIVLSACQTGLGRDISGEGLVGLTRGFMYAGAARVVVSLWNVDDQATAALMVGFYKRMLGHEHLSPAHALHAAQMEVASEPRWRSPHYWAGFVLHGEPR